MTRFGVDAIRGIVPPIATPINKDETVDEQGMRRLVDFQLEQGANAIFVMGGTGEFFCFPDGEKRRAIETVVDQVAGRAPVIAGITDLSTRRAVANAHVAQEAGADFLTSLPPCFFALQQDWLHNFYTSVAAETDLPLLLYNILNPIHTNIQPQTVRSLSENPKIVGIKDSEEYAHVQEVVFQTDNDRFRVLTGLEHNYYASLNVGAAGGVLSAANFCTSLCRGIYDNAAAGRNEDAKELQARLNRLLGELQGFTSWWGVVKMCLSILGICDNAVTHPMPACTEEERPRLAAIMKKYDLL